MYSGLLYGSAGTLLGVPLGLGLAYLIYLGFTEFLTAGFHVHEAGLVFACLGSVLSGLIGAAYPAYLAATISPLAGLKVQAGAPKPRGVVFCGLLGAALIVLQLVLLYAPQELESSFWLYASFALPAMYLGYFLISVPVAWLVASVVGEPITRLLRLPPGMLRRIEHAAPYRFGLTAAAQMVGLSIMITVWSSGMSLFRDWIDAVRFPDAVAHAWFGIPEEKYDLLKSMDVVEQTCATSIFPVDTREERLFGVGGLQQFKVNFVSFEPDEFFQMTAVEWIAGDPQHARRMLDQGGGVLVAREFLIASGLGVGDTIELGYEGQWAEFEIVGVVMSPGLNIATRLFGIGDAYLEQAISSVFGSRADAIEHFDNDDINLIQINLDDDVSEDLALARIEAEMDVRGLSTGSGKQLRAMIDQLGGGALAIGTVIAFTGLLVASFGVGNIIMANLEARRYEHGVLIAVGAKRGMLARTVVAEALIIAIVAWLLGTAVGLQAANAANVLYGMYGLVLRLSIPLGPILFAWTALLLCTLIFVIPPIRKLRRTSPRELLSGSE
jgi:putative ABC transport system permease protein